MIWFTRIAIWAAIWWICSGMFEPFFGAMAVISFAIVFFVSRRLELFGKADDTSLLTSPLKAVRYFAWLLKEIYLSSLNVTRLIWQVAPAPRPVLGWAETKLRGDEALALYGSSITLTPGTITADIVEEKNRTLMLVHSLELAGFKDIESGRMAKKIGRVYAKPKGKKAGDAWW